MLRYINTLLISKLKRENKCHWPLKAIDFFHRQMAEDAIQQEQPSSFFKIPQTILILVMKQGVYVTTLVRKLCIQIWKQTSGCQIARRHVSQSHILKSDSAPWQLFWRFFSQLKMLKSVAMQHFQNKQEVIEILQHFLWQYPDHFSYYCISQLWSTGFLQSLTVFLTTWLQYFLTKIGWRGPKTSSVT